MSESNIAEGVKRARIARFFAPWPLWQVAPAPAGLIIAAIGVAARTRWLFIPGILVAFCGMILIARLVGAKPSDAQMDEWLAEDVDALFERARKSLTIEPEQVIAEPVLVGPGLLFMGWPEAARIEPEHLPPNAWKAARDGVLRVGAFSYQVLFPMDRFLAAFTCVYDFIEGKAYNERTEEFFYRDVVSVATRVDEMAVEKIARKGLLRRKETASYKFNDFESFRLTVTSGESLSVVVKCREPQKALLGREASLSAGPHDEAVAAIRKLLREKK